MCHQSLELAFLKLSRVFARNEACADRKPAVHRSRAAMKSAVPMAACFNRTNCKHFSSIHGCLYGFSRIIFVGMNLLHVERTIGEVESSIISGFVLKERLPICISKNLPNICLLSFTKIEAFARGGFRKSNADVDISDNTSVIGFQNTWMNGTFYL